MTSSNNIKFSAFDGDRLSHAYIADGNAAETIAAAVVCSGQGDAKPCLKCQHCGKAARHIHPDITVISKFTDKQAIIVDQIRDLKKDALVVPCESAKKAYIINDADIMNISSQNAFLQLLEDPPSHAVFILKTENPSELLPTVRSRCVEIKTRTGKEPVPATANMASEFFTALEGGNFMLAALMFRLEKLGKDGYADFLAAAREQASVRLRAAVRSSSELRCWTLTRVEKAFAEAEEMLTYNVSTGHISGLILASMTEPQADR